MGSDEIKSEKLRIVYVNCDKNFKETKDFEGLKAVKGKTYDGDVKETMIADLGERFGLLIHGVVSKLPTEKTFSLGLIFKKDRFGQKFDFYWCTGLCLNNRIQQLGTNPENASLKMIETLIIYEDRQLEIEDQVQGFNNSNSSYGLDRIRKLEAVLKKYNNQFKSQANYLKDNGCLEKEKIDWYSQVHFQELNNGSLLVKANNVILRRLDELSRKKSKTGKFFFCIVDVTTYEQQVGAKRGGNEPTFTLSIANSLCVKQVSAVEPKISILKHIRKTFDENITSRVGGWYQTTSRSSNIEPLAARKEILEFLSSD
jgi:hypothetical protein